MEVEGINGNGERREWKWGKICCIGFEEMDVLVTAFSLIIIIVFQSN